jgi:hypothetical protein
VAGDLTAAEILADLDDDASSHAAFFPDFDHGYHYHVDARLTAYGDGRRWVVVIEQVSVNPRAGGGIGGVHTILYYHGNARSACRRSPAGATMPCLPPAQAGVEGG